MCQPFLANMEDNHLALGILQLEADVFLAPGARVEDNIVDTEAVTYGQVLDKEAGLSARLHVDNVSLLSKDLLFFSTFISSSSHYLKSLLQHCLLRTRFTFSSESLFSHLPRLGIGGLVT